jgi:hypothetical protein
MDLSKVADYQSLKTVKAIQIKEILFDRVVSAKEQRASDGSAILVPKLRKHKKIKVNDRFVSKNNLIAGGYLLLDNGPQQFLSEEEFEAQYETTPFIEAKTDK